MKLTAKFRSQCIVCAGVIRPGDSIEYEKGKGSWHAKCAGKQPALLNSRRPDQMLAGDADLAAHAKQHGRTIDGEPAIVSLMLEAPAKAGEVIPGRGNKRLLLLAVSAARYYSRDFLEDMDMFDMRPGRYVDVQAVVVLPTEAEQAEEAERAARKQAAADEAARKKAAIEQARKDFDAELARLTDGLVRTSSVYYDLLADDARGPYVAEWRNGNNYAQIKTTVSKVTGGRAVLYPHGGYDDYRVDMFVDQATLEAAFVRRREESAKYGERHTPATGREFLEKYKGCVGTEYYEWLAAQEEVKL